MCQRYKSEILRDGGAYYRAYLRAERDRPEYAERKRRRQQLTGLQIPWPLVRSGLPPEVRRRCPNLTALVS